jgi:hypothetical protein
MIDVTRAIDDVLMLIMMDVYGIVMAFLLRTAAVFTCNAIQALGLTSRLIQPARAISQEVTLLFIYCRNDAFARAIVV